MTRLTMQVELRIALSYALFGGLWILLSDKLAAVFSEDTSTLSRIQTFKGWAFVAAGALLIYYLLRYDRRYKQFNEKALDESQNRLRSVLDNAPIVLISTDRNGIFTLSEGAGLKRTGIKPGRVVGLSAYDLYGSLAIFLPNGKAISGEELLYRVLNGETIIAATEVNGAHFENRFAPLLNRDETVDGLVGVAIDVTERSLAEENLREAEAQYRTLVEQIPPIVYLCGPNQYMGVTYISPRINILGFTQEEWVADPELWFRQIHPEDQKKVLDEIEKIKRNDTREVSSGDEALILEYRLISRDGNERWILDESLNVLDDHGKIIFRQGIMLDITERKRTEEKFAFQENLLANINDAIFVSDEKFAFTAWNSAAEQVYGWKAEEVIGKSGAEILHTEFLTISRPEAIKQLMETGEFFDEVIQLRKDGTKIHVETRTTALRDQNGKTTGYITVNRDITKRKFAEEEVRLSRDRLAELSRRLVETQEKESRAIGRELHDQIGQMLTAMKITLDMIPQLPAELAAGKIKQAQVTVDDLLSRVSRLSLELRPPMLDDLGLIPALQWHVHHYQDQTGIPVEFIHRDIEGRRFEQEIETTAYRIIQETLTNVARHAHATRVKLEVQERSGKMEIHIEDDGQGYDPKAALAKNRGLSGMRERAGLIGGTFQIESEPGKGTKTRIQLPFGEET